MSRETCFHVDTQLDQQEYFLILLKYQVESRSVDMLFLLRFVQRTGGQTTPARFFEVSSYWCVTLSTHHQPTILTSHQKKLSDSSASLTHHFCRF
jgi:hypothetical protein